MVSYITLAVYQFIVLQFEIQLFHPELSFVTSVRISIKIDYHG